MSKGRKNIPTALHILRGNPSKKNLDEQQKKEPKLAVEIPRTPSHLTDLAKQHFKKMAKQLAQMKVMTKQDTDALVIYCEAYSKWYRANEELKTCDWITFTENGHPIKSPWLTISDNAFNQMKSIMTEFGLTPASRTKVQVISDDTKDADPWSRI